MQIYEMKINLCSSSVEVGVALVLMHTNATKYCIKFSVKYLHSALMTKPAVNGYK